MSYSSYNTWVAASLIRGWIRKLLYILSYYISLYPSSWVFKSHLSPMVLPVILTAAPSLHPQIAVLPVYLFSGHQNTRTFPNPTFLVSCKPADSSTRFSSKEAKRRLSSFHLPFKTVSANKRNLDWIFKYIQWILRWPSSI